MKKPTKAQIKKERNRTKIKEVLIKKGYKDGKVPKGKELHHIKEVSKGGKTTVGNTRVISRKKHIKIHKKRNLN